MGVGNMLRKVFFSFHFDNDYWRTQQVRNMGSIDGQTICTPNAWEEVKQKGSAAIEEWIDNSLKEKSCVVVLVGAETASRQWVCKEISKGWNVGKGVVAIRVDKLLDRYGKPAAPGINPLTKVNFKASSKTLADVARLKTPAGNSSKEVYANIAENIGDWIEEAIAIRKAN